MKNLFAIITTLAICIGYVSAQKLANINTNAFAFKTLDGKPFTKANLKKDKSTLVMFFDPYCDHCELQSKWFAADAAKLKGVQFLLVTTEPTVQASLDFKKKCFGTAAIDVTILLDDKFRFDAYFGYSETPSMYLFNKKGDHTKSYKHETKPAEMLPFF